MTTLLLLRHIRRASHWNGRAESANVDALVAMGYNRQDIEDSLSQVRYDDVFATYLLLGRKSTDVSSVPPSLTLLSIYIYRYNTCPPHIHTTHHQSCNCATTVLCTVCHHYYIIARAITSVCTCKRGQMPSRMRSLKHHKMSLIRLLID